MIFKQLLAAFLLIFTSISSSLAEPQFVKTFNPGSYQQILRENAGQAFVLAIWSVDCPSCIKDMTVLSQIRQSHPNLKIIMLSTDEPANTSEAKNILTRYQLNDLESWIFGSDDAQKLRYEIDPSWYGELPRTYFFTSTHSRTGKSGALKIEAFEAQIANIAG
jgi:thiol-disulfide isomerase/thioredoxin